MSEIILMPVFQISVIAGIILVKSVLKINRLKDEDGTGRLGILPETLVVIGSLYIIFLQF